MSAAQSGIEQANLIRRRRHKQVATFGTALVLVLAGCGDDKDDSAGATPASGEGATVVQADVKEFSLVLSSEEVKAGSVTIEAHNKGTIVHELVIFKSDAAIDALPQVDGKVPEDDPNVAFVDEISEFDAGASASGTFDLDPGKYILICNIPAHYEQGMRAALTVTD